MCHTTVIRVSEMQENRLSFDPLSENSHTKRRAALNNSPEPFPAPSRRCRGGTFALSDTTTGTPADYCVPCPSGAACSGGAVVVPATTKWHSAAASPQMHAVSGSECSEGGVTL